jgi:glutaminase
VYKRETLGLASKVDLIATLANEGLSADDTRIRNLLATLPEFFSQDEFVKLVSATPCEPLVNALTGRLVIPAFNAFTESMSKIFDSAKTVSSGTAVTLYASQRNNEDSFGMAVCSTSGQRWSKGDTRTQICMAGLTAALNYCLAQDLRGTAKVHQHIGREPSGCGADDITLNDDDKPHNPLINTGAINICSLIKPDEPLDTRFDLLQNVYSAAAGRSPVNYCNQFFARERRNSDRK